MSQSWCSRGSVITSHSGKQPNHCFADAPTNSAVVKVINAHFPHLSSPSVHLVRHECLELVDVRAEAPEADLLDLGRVDEVSVRLHPFFRRGTLFIRGGGVSEDVERACRGERYGSALTASWRVSMGRLGETKRVGGPR